MLAGEHMCSWLGASNDPAHAGLFAELGIAADEAENVVLLRVSRVGNRNRTGGTFLRLCG